jgi:hypothetical protein
LLSDPEDLEHDYQSGLQAGYNFVQLYDQLNIDLDLDGRESA